jgi:hypothetical protein
MSEIWRVSTGFGGGVAGRGAVTVGHGGCLELERDAPWLNRPQNTAQKKLLRRAQVVVADLRSSGAADYEELCMETHPLLRGSTSNNTTGPSLQPGCF